MVLTSLSLFFSLFSPVPLLLSLFFCPIFCMLSWTLQKNLAGMVTFCSCLSSYSLYRHTHAGVCLCVRESRAFLKLCLLLCINNIVSRIRLAFFPKGILSKPHPHLSLSFCPFSLSLLSLPIHAQNLAYVY